MQSYVRFNRVPEKILQKVPVPEKVLEGLGAARFNEASTRFRRDSGRVSVQLFGQVQVPANFRPKPV